MGSDSKAVTKRCGDILCEERYQLIRHVFLVIKQHTVYIIEHYPSLVQANLAIHNIAPLIAASWSGCAGMLIIVVPISTITHIAVIYIVQKHIWKYGKSHGLLSGKKDDLRVGERARIPVGVEAVNVTTLEYKACATNP